MTDQIAFFDSHLHIIDPRFPLTPNNNYLPEPFTAEMYRQRVSNFKLTGGAIVSGSLSSL